MTPERIEELARARAAFHKKNADAETNETLKRLVRHKQAEAEYLELAILSHVETQS